MRHLPSISLSGATHAALKAWAESRGETMSSVIERVLEPVLSSGVLPPSLAPSPSVGSGSVTDAGLARQSRLDPPVRSASASLLEDLVARGFRGRSLGRGDHALPRPGRMATMTSVREAVRVAVRDVARLLYRATGYQPTALGIALPDQIYARFALVEAEEASVSYEKLEQDGYVDTVIDGIRVRIIADRAVASGG